MAAAKIKAITIPPRPPTAPPTATNNPVSNPKNSTVFIRLDTLSPFVINMVTQLKSKQPPCLCQRRVTGVR
jgi:hypothetical protein